MVYQGLPILEMVVYHGVYTVQFFPPFPPRKKCPCPARWRNAGLIGRALWPQSAAKMAVLWGSHGDIMGICCNSWLLFHMFEHYV